MFYVSVDIFNIDTAKVRLNGRESYAFSVMVGLHTGSVLSPLLFIITGGLL